MHLLAFRDELARDRWLWSLDLRVCEARTLPTTIPKMQKGSPNPVMVAAAANNTRAKWRAVAMDAWPDIQPTYDHADDQDHGSPPPKEQQT